MITNYKIDSFGGVECIVWSFIDLEDDSQKAKACRRCLKDSVGKMHLNVPMLDSKTVTDGSDFCESIVVSNYLIK